MSKTVDECTLIRRWWARGAGTVLIAGGALMMAGWLLRIPVWERISPTATLMVFSTALCFALCGIGLLASWSRTGHARGVRDAAAVSVVVIAVSVLAENIFLLDLGIDLPELHSWYQDRNPHPGRMAPNTAIAFMIAATVMLIDRGDSKRGPLLSMLAAVVVTLGAIGLVGYTFLFDLAYGWYDIPRMAATTAVGMILLGSGLVVTHMPGNVEQEQKADSRGYAFLGVAITILAMLVFVSFGSIKALIDRSAWVEHGATVRAEFEAMVALEARAHSAWRIHLSTGSASLGREMLGAGQAMHGRLSLLENLTADNPGQQRRLAEMRTLVEKNTALLASAPARRPTGDLMTALEGNRNHFERLVEEFRMQEARLLRERQLESRQGAATTITVILIGNFIGFAILFYSGWILKRQNDQRALLASSLQRSNAFLDSLVEHIPNMVFVKDAEELRFVRFNKAGEALLGFAKEELLDKNDYDFFPREEADFFTANDRAVLRGSEIVDIPEEPIHTRHMGVRTLHTKKIPILDDHGQPRYLLGISEDITDRLQAEREIAGLNADLRTRAAELEATNQELESFTYSVSHDLRAPLRAINGYALMLEEDYRDRIDDAGKRYIEQIRAYSSQMGALIDDLLRLSRLGRQALMTVEVDMNALVRDVLRDELGIPGATVTVRASVADLPGAHADPQLLRQVWANLISNALKYSSKSADPMIEVSGHTEGSETIYSVRDNGVGFDMAYRDKLFKVFQRLHRADEFPGTGIGLAIVHRVVTRHGGRVWAEATSGQGAEFSFALPRRS